MLRAIAIIAAAALAPTLASAKSFSVEAGPLWNQAHAEQVCPGIAETLGASWTGQWWTTKPSAMSVCQVSTAPKTVKVSVEAGPLWNQGHASKVCPGIAASLGGKWTGHWWTTKPGEMSVCQIER